jgi:hypothetical protein
LAMAALMLRTAGGIGALIAILILFRPLLTGIWHVLVMTIKPRLTLQQRSIRHSYQSASILGHITDENSISQLNLVSAPENKLNK